MSMAVRLAILAWLTFAALAASPVSPASAQIPGIPSVTSAPEPAAIVEPTQADLRELARLLKDPAIAHWLENQASGDIAGNDGTVDTESVESEEIRRIRERIGAVKVALAGLPAMPMAVADAWNGLFPAEGRLQLRILTLIFLFIGAGLEWLYWCYASPAKKRIEARPRTGFYRTALAALLRLVLTMSGAAAFGIGTVGSFLAFDWPPGFRIALLDTLWAIVLVRAIAALIEFVLAPRVDALRLIPIDRRDARWLSTAFLVMAIALFFGHAFSNVLMQSGTPDAIWIGLDIVVTAIALIVAIGTIWSLFLRHAGHYIPFEGACPRVRGLLVPVLATICLIAIYLLWLVGAVRLAATLGVIAVTIPAAILARRTVQGAFTADPQALAAAREEETAEPVAGAEAEEAQAQAEEEDDDGRAGEPPEASIYQPIAERLARFSVLGTAALALAFIWGFDFGDLAETTSFAGRAANVVINIAIAFLIGDLVWVITRTAIDRRLASMPKLEPGHAPGPEARLATLLPIFRLAALITIFTMVFMVTLSELGVDIGPLLAGAGVIGLAVGFGAQALVRDIVSGVFFLIDDAFRVGEYIEMGELRGTVESISLRSLRVRHHRGAVHTIPFGELKSLTNYSRDWVMMKLEFRVPFDTDLKLAKKLVKQIDQELRANPDYGDSFLEPLKFQGVRRMEEFNMVVGVKFMTRPGEQWTIRRDAYQRIRDEFEKHGIHFAQRNVKVEVIGNQPLTDDVKQAALGAAQDAIEQQIGNEAPAR